jgi:hypothetical protein
MILTEIPKNAYLFLRGLKNWQQFVLSLILAATLIYFVGRESIDGYIKHKSDIEIEKLKQNDQEKKRKDSIHFSKAQQFWEQSIKDELYIRKICDNMEDYFENETQISLLKLHDHGDVLAPENNPRVTVKWSSLFDIQDTYQNQPVYTGALWSLNEADEKGFIYLPKVEEVANYWKGREKAFHESIGSKSAAFMFIKDIRKDNAIVSKWFIAIHWELESPYPNPYLLRIQMDKFKTLIESKIYIAPEHLRAN